MKMQRINLKDRIELFSELGEILRNSLGEGSTPFSARIKDLIASQHLKNRWFTPSNVELAINAIARELTYDNLVRWTNFYPELEDERPPLRVAVIMAGNIPLAGFHDLLCVLISGNTLIARTSSKDPDLLRFVGEIVMSKIPAFSNRIIFTENTLKGFDAVIATGSDNSSRYFEYYFSGYPNIIRKNRNSLAIIEGNETSSQLEALGYDVFSYFGLGCRSVSKVHIPSGYDISTLTDNWRRFAEITDHSGYASNYDFNKAVYLVNKEKFTDAGFILLKENPSLSSPVAVLHYEYYNRMEDVLAKIMLHKEKIQCITGRDYISFGEAQFPHLWDYADGIDTLGFLLKKF